MSKQSPRNTTVAVYVRVSTAFDQEKGLKSQEQAIAGYLAGHGLDAVFYRDRQSGKNLKRPAFEKLQRDIFSGRIRTVIVWKLDRLSRSMRDGINILADWCERGVRTISVTQQLDLSGSVGHLIAGVLFAVAQMERDHLSENTRRGLAGARCFAVPRQAHALIRLGNAVFHPDDPAS